MNLEKTFLTYKKNTETFHSIFVSIFEALFDPSPPPTKKKYNPIHTFSQVHHL